MSDEYQLRKDIDRFKKFLDQLESVLSNKMNIDDLNVEQWLSGYYDITAIDTLVGNINSELADKVDEADIDSALGQKADKTEVESAVSTLNGLISGKANTVHSHDNWRVLRLNSACRLYVNEDLQVCELVYSGKITGASANTYYNWFTGIIPKEYRPISNIYGTTNYGDSFHVTVGGSIGVYFIAQRGASNCMSNVMWHYSKNIVETNWYNHNNLNVTTSTNQISLSNTGTSFGLYLANMTGTPASSLTDVEEWDSPFEVTFTVVSYTGNTYFYLYDGTATQKSLSELGVTSNSKVSINSDGETIIYNIDDDEPIVVETGLGTSRVGFRLNANATLTFKDFEINQ